MEEGDGVCVCVCVRERERERENPCLEGEKKKKPKFDCLGNEVERTMPTGYMLIKENGNTSSPDRQKGLVELPSLTAFHNSRTHEQFKHSSFSRVFPLRSFMMLLSSVRSVYTYTHIPGSALLTLLSQACIILSRINSACS